MKKSVTYLLFVIGSFAGNSCQLRSDEPHPTQDLTSSGKNSSTVVRTMSSDDSGVINQTRIWFEGQLNDATVLDVSVAYTKPLKWDWATLEQGSNGNLIISVPEEDYFTRPTYSSQMSSHGCRSLVFIRNQAGSYSTEIMELRPDEAYIQNQGGDPLNLRPLIHSDNYTGYVLYYNGVTGKLTMAIRYEQGKAVHTLDIPA